MKDADWEQLLRQSLSSAAEPDEALNQRIIRQIAERSQFKPKYRRRLSTGLVAVVLLLVLSLSAYAAERLFSAKEVAEHVGDQLLAEAFESADAIPVNQSAASGDYNFTLHGLVSGAGLSEFRESSEDIYPDRTYAVISIARQDGKPMPDTTDPAFGQDPFFISPLIKGQKPWLVNIVTMNGAYIEDVIDGVMYRIIECDQIEMFADRGVYLAISSGSPFYNNEAFAYDAATGEIQAKEDYPGVSLLLNLPLDTAKADHAKADAYLNNLLNPAASQEQKPSGNASEQSSDTAAVSEEEEWVSWMNSIRDKLRNGETIGETIAESVKEVSYDDSGKITYTYEDLSVTETAKDLFAEGQIGFSDKRLPMSGDSNNVYKAVLFHQDENGVITGRIVVLDSFPSSFYK